jgi:ribonucleoside-triphosphate reductase (formate)
MPIFKVRKRNGSLASFERAHIERAIGRACAATVPADAREVSAIADIAIQAVESECEAIPDVEAIQDRVERALMDRGHDEAAKAYILYRARRADLRADRAVTVEVERTMDEYLGRTDWRVNANANSGYSLGGLILNTAGKVTANYWLSHVYSREAGEAHRNADMHIHDLDMFSGYCAGWSLRALLEEGLGGLQNRVESAPPRNLQSAVNQMINFLGTLQNEWAGAQAFSSFDTYLSPFVHKYRRELEEELAAHGMGFASEAERERYLEEKTYRHVRQNMQNFVFGLNVPSRWGTQTPFTNITLDWTCPADLSSQRLHIGGYDAEPYERTFGELDRERALINRALIEVYLAGDAKGRVFTFPIPTYNITEDFPWDDPATEHIFEMTAKYGIPYFQNFVGSQYKTERAEDGTMRRVRNPHAYEPGAVRSMCCRLQLDLRELLKRGNGLFGSAEMTGSLGVVTINMARIGYLHAGDEAAFKRQVRKLMDLARETLETKRETATKWLKGGLYPYTARYLRSFRNHFSTIGLNGMNEAIRNFTEDRENISTAWGHAFALDILDFMRETLREYQEETGNLYNLEATPAEGTTYRFAKEDRRQLPGIIQAGTPEAPYYTNSTQLPVGYTDDAFEALDRQNELQCRYTGGTVLHLYLGERVSDARACRDLVRKAVTQYQLPYITITPTFSICPKHGYLSGEHDYCPRCDEEIGYRGERYDLALRTRHTEDAVKLERLSRETVGA